MARSRRRVAAARERRIRRETDVSRLRRRRAAVDQVVRRRRRPSRPEQYKATRQAVRGAIYRPRTSSRHRSAGWTRLPRQRAEARLARAVVTQRARTRSEYAAVAAVKALGSRRDVQRTVKQRAVRDPEFAVRAAICRERKDRKRSIMAQGSGGRRTRRPEYSEVSKVRCP